jgi:cohesin complex subunit SCC1
MTLLEARLNGRLADHIFSPPSIHPQLRAMLSPEYFRRFGIEGTKRKRVEESGITPKKARIEDPPILDEQGFGDGGFGDFGQDSGFGAELDFGERPPSAIPEPERHRTSSPSLIDDRVEEEEEVPTSITGSMSHSTVIAAQLLQKELTPGNTVTLDDLTERAVVGGQVKREDAVKMFFECLVLASRDVIRVQQKSGFSEIRVQGKDALFKVGGFGSSQQILV